MPSTSRRQLHAPFIAGVCLLAAQVVVAVGHAFSDRRLVDYTPYSGMTAYRLNVSIAGAPLTDQQVRARYGIPFRGRLGITPAGLQHLVIWRESESARRETFVRLHFSRQRGPEQIWLWPQQ